MANLQRLRIDRNKAFTTINNTILRDNTISLKARGLMVTIMGLPDNWDFTVQGIVSILKEGRDAVYSAISELKEAGYVTVEQSRDENGRLSESVYVFRETPYREQPSAEVPYTEKPYTDNPTQLKKQSINKTKNQRKKGYVSETLTNTPTSILRSYFPSIPLNASWSKRLDTVVTDFTAWERSVKTWRLDGYKPGKKLLEYYFEEISGNPYAHFDAFQIR